MRKTIAVGLLVGVGAAVAVAVAVASGALGSKTRAPLSGAAVAAAPAVRAVDALPDPPVRFANPFDHSEMFEFPAGTSEEDARQQVADILLQRARDRGVAVSRRKTGVVRH